MGISSGVNYSLVIIALLISFYNRNADLDKGGCDDDADSL